MKHYGAALFVILLAACSSPESEPTSPPQTAVQDLNRFADDLMANSDGNLKNPEYAAQSGYKPLSFVLMFRTSSPSLLSKANADRDPAAYESNVKNTDAWQRTFCTPKLKSIMREHEIFLVAGHLLNENNELQALASCML